jgi:hypothetical protein
VYFRGRSPPREIPFRPVGLPTGGRRSRGTGGSVSRAAMRAVIGAPSLWWTGDTIVLFHPVSPGPPGFGHALDIPAQFRMGPVDVKGRRLGIGEIVERCIRQEEELQERIETHTYTQVVKTIYHHGGYGYEVRLTPKSDFEIAPQGRIWIETSDFQILREEFDFGDRVPMPLFVRSIGPFIRERERIGEVWVWKRFLIRVDTRADWLPFLGSKVPRVVECHAFFQDHQLNEIGGDESGVGEGAGRMGGENER